MALPQQISGIVKPQRITGIVRTSRISGIVKSPYQFTARLPKEEVEEEEDHPRTIVTSQVLQFGFDGKNTDAFELNGNKIIQWDDESEFVRDISNAIDGRRPTYDPETGIVIFTAANQTYLRCSAANFGTEMAQPNTIYVVYKITGALTDLEMVFDGVAKRNLFYYQTSLFKLFAGVIMLDGATNANDNIHIGKFNGLTSNYWINGVNVAAGTTGNNSLYGIVLAAAFVLNYPSDVKIRCAWGWNGDLTNQEHKNMHDWINTRYGLSIPNPW